VKTVLAIMGSIKKDLYGYNASVVELRDSALLVLQSNQKDIIQEKMFLNNRLEKAIKNISIIIGDNRTIDSMRQD